MTSGKTSQGGSMDSDDTIRLKIKAVLQSAAPLAVVFPWWVLKDGFDQWPGILRADSTDLDPATGKKRIHAYVIKREDSQGEWVAAKREKRRYFYQIFAFHYFSLGSETDNSEKLFIAEIDSITALFAVPENLDHSLKRVEPIRWQTRVNTGQFGETLHIGIGSLELQPC